MLARAQNLTDEERSARKLANADSTLASDLLLSENQMDTLFARAAA